ncbi:hypothetical protein CYMTET_9192, partial [Cymbomonas tetramitiformis]
VYLYRSGFARFSNSRFSTHKDDICNNYIHLTNVAVQKMGANYDAATGMKWALRDLKLFLLSRHPADLVHQAFLAIESLILRSLLAVANTIINDKHSFELYGYDIMIDDRLKPWLIEVNSSPSLTSDTPADHELKCTMLHDTLDLIDMEQRVAAGIPRSHVGGFDLIWDGGPVVHEDRYDLCPSFLGTHNPQLQSEYQTSAEGQA